MLHLHANNDRGNLFDHWFSSSLLTTKPNAYFDVHHRHSTISPIASTTSVRGKGTVRAKQLAQQWYIGIETAKRTIER
jgi:hypothetical protein